MNRHAIVGAFLLHLLGASFAEAADLQINTPMGFMPPQAFSWTGFYLGGNVGAGIGTTETSVNVGPALTALSGMSVSATAPLVSETFNGFIGGLQAGYNWQAASLFSA
jgi:outer membrane immunogenic protein